MLAFLLKKKNNLKGKKHVSKFFSHSYKHSFRCAQAQNVVKKLPKHYYYVDCASTLQSTWDRVRHPNPLEIDRIVICVVLPVKHK
jgi:DUF2075 family protein